MSENDVEIVRRMMDAYNLRDFDVALSFFAPDAVFDASHRGLGVFQGQEMIRKVGEAWLQTFEDFETELRDVADFGRGVVFTVQRTLGRPGGSGYFVEGWEACVAVLQNGQIAYYTNYSNIDEARAAAERLAESRE
jgi:ketosteroid isomerase-like protein